MMADMCMCMHADGLLFMQRKVPCPEAAEDIHPPTRLIVSSVQKPSYQSGSVATGCYAPSSSAIPLPTVSFPSLLITPAGTGWRPPCLLRGASVALHCQALGHCSALYTPGSKFGDKSSGRAILGLECQRGMCPIQDRDCDQLVLPCSLPLYPYGRLHLWSAWACPLHGCVPLSMP